VPRSLGNEYLGVIHHVMNRGNRRRDIIGGDPNREVFLIGLWVADLIWWCSIFTDAGREIVESPKNSLDLQWVAFSFLR